MILCEYHILFIQSTNRLRFFLIFPIIIAIYKIVDFIFRHTVWDINLQISMYLNLKNFDTMIFIFHIYIHGIKQYCYNVGRYYFTRIWKILHWKYHRDICKKHSLNISPLCHMITNTSRTLVKDMISNARYFWRGKFYLFFVESAVSGEKSTSIPLALVEQSLDINLPLEKRKLGIIVNCINILVKNSVTSTFKIISFFFVRKIDCRMQPWLQRNDDLAVLTFYHR